MTDEQKINEDSMEDILSSIRETVEEEVANFFFDEWWL